MAPPGSEDHSSEDDSFPPPIDLAAPSASVYTSTPVAGFSHDASGPHSSAHNTTLGGSVLDHRQPPAAPGTRDTSLPSLDASAASCSTPSLVTRARGVHESTAPSLSSSLPTYHCRHDSTSESGATFTAPLLFTTTPASAALRPHVPPAPSCGGDLPAPPGDEDRHRRMPPPPPANILRPGAVHDSPGPDEFFLARLEVR
ncbi:hypothetical protein AB1Y20_022182 [Prymnesium parvum]|uniref:Uncharacterized protein n=1 Tax=Prymnesium parvum TaxID=97485 RepID=A0AB34JGG5_PRYPA